MELKRDEIIKALECCLVESNCTGCPLHHQYETDCLKYAGEKALSLIKELTEENERLRKDNERYAELEQGWIVTGVKKVKADTVQKMQERIEALFPSDKNFTTISRFTVRQITKEMLEGGG